MGKHRIPADKYIPGKGTKRFVNSRQCAAMYRVGNRVGTRCTWYAQEGREYCVKHGNSTRPRSPEHLAAIDKGRKAWWQRLHDLEKTHPGIMRQALNTDGALATRAARREVKKTMPAPETDDKIVLKAHKELVAQVASLPKVPDKPFDELEPHEQLVVITGQSLKVVHEILTFKLKDANGEVNLKVASMVKDTALRALATRVKIDRNALTARKLDNMVDLLQRLKNGDGAKVIEG